MKRKHGYSLKNKGIALFVGLALLIQYFEIFLVLILLLAIALLIYCIYLRGQHNKNLSVDMSEIDLMKGTDFEVYVASILRKCGFKDVRVTKKSGDYGADIIARDKTGNVVFQCKRYNETVGVSAVQEVVAARIFYGCNKAIVITNSRFTKEAVKFAAGTGAALWERKDLINLIYRARSPKKLYSPLLRHVHS